MLGFDLHNIMGPLAEFQEQLIAMIGDTNTKLDRVIELLEQNGRDN